MKKLNNRQNQVKSLDFSNNQNFLYNQVLQKSPKIMKNFNGQQHQSSMLMNGGTITTGGVSNSKNPQKSEIQHFNKKNHQMLASSNQFNKNVLSGQLTQVESTQSIKTSPVKSDIGPKNYPQSIQKTTTQKNQKIKIGMHKKAVSLMGSQHTSQLSNLQNENNILDYTKQSNQIKALNSQKQSYLASQQTSFNDYNSNNGGNHGLQSSNINNIQFAVGGGEIMMLPKVDNFLQGTDKNSSILTAQQQLQMRTFQKVLQDSQLSQDQFGNTIDVNIKTFDQRPPLNQVLSQHQSQRLSIISDASNHPSHPPSAGQGYRSHANSFKAGTTSNQITMKHPPNKYIKGQTQQDPKSFAPSGTVLQGSATLSKGKKTLQFHHQRTFSDNPNSMNSKGQLLNPSATAGGQMTNRNFQELIKSVNNREQQLIQEAGFINTVGLTTTNITQENYPLSGFSHTIQNTGLSGFAAKTTIGSSRQSAQSQTLLEDKDIILQHYNQGAGHEKYTDLKQIYQGVLKDQIAKTKQALKLTQQQFGGPSRKVVQNNRMNGSANTQSYRQSQQNTITAGSISKVSTMVDPKSTPKISVKKSGQSSSNHSYNLSSAHGSRTVNNGTSLHVNNQQIVYSEKIKKGKGSKIKQNYEPILQPPLQNEIAIEGDQKQTGKNFYKMGTQGGHKRSASDGNQAIFQSLSNRGNMNLTNHLAQNQQQNIINSQTQSSQLYKQNPLTQSLNMGIAQSEMIKAGFSKQQSLSKMQQQQNTVNAYQQITGRPQNNNEYQIISDRHSYNHSVTIQPGTNAQQNVMVFSHRKIGGGQETKHQRHNSDQISLDASSKVLHGSQQQPQIQKKRSIKSSKAPQTQQVSSGEMMIQDQGINQVSVSHIKQINLKDLQTYQKPKAVISPQDLKQNSFYRQANQPSQSVLHPVQERIETQESIASDPSLTPRSRMNFKLHKKIKMAFQKAQNPASPSSGFQTTSEFYKIGKVMGKGAFGKVNLAIHRLSSKFVALKSINKQFLSEEASKRKVMQEFNILRRTRHKNVVRLYESFETQQHIVFVMEVCGAGDLLTYVRRRRKLKEDVAKNLFKQIIEGLRYCHSKNILHRDIKLDNILLTSEGDIKICDFGVSKLVKNGDIMTEQCGTPAYIAPEVFENKGYEGYQSDVWSAGVVLYAMLYGTVPFKANNMTELQKQITKNSPSYKDEISPEAISLLKGILEKDPQKRLKSSDILKHVWMSDVPETINVFTDQEKQKIISEFAYYNFKSDQGGNGGGSDEIVHTDPFTEQMLNSTQNSLVKNASTKSIILAPFNSTRSNIDDNHHLRKSIQELLVDKKQIKFAAKVKEIDRQYEQNNNAELDNGVYHQDSEEEEEEKKKQAAEDAKKAQKKHGSIETSFENDKQSQDGITDTKKQHQPKSEWQMIEQMVIDHQKTEQDEDDYATNTHSNNFGHNGLLGNLGSAQTLVIDERVVSEIEKVGFPKSYIVNSLNNDELNYVTAYYYLMNTTKEY